MLTFQTHEPPLLCIPDPQPLLKGWMDTDFWLPFRIQATPWSRKTNLQPFFSNLSPKLLPLSLFPYLPKKVVSVIFKHSKELFRMRCKPRLWHVIHLKEWMNSPCSLNLCYVVKTFHGSWNLSSALLEPKGSTVAHSENHWPRSWLAPLQVWNATTPQWPIPQKSWSQPFRGVPLVKKPSLCLSLLRLRK